MQWQNCIASVSYQQLPSLRINTKLIYRAVKTFRFLEEILKNSLPQKQCPQ